MKRIQRKRTSGWKMPENTVYVGRPTKWGNPYVVGEKGIAPVYLLNFYRAPVGYKKFKVTKQNCLKIFKLYVSLRLSIDPKYLDPLKGKDVACWCKLDTPCHADILLEFLHDDQKTN